MSDQSRQQRSPTYDYRVNGDECSIRRRQGSTVVGADTLLTKAGFRHQRFELFHADDDPVDGGDWHFRGEQPIGEPIEEADLTEHDRFVAVPKSDLKTRQHRQRS